LARYDFFDVGIAETVGSHEAMKDSSFSSDLRWERLVEALIALSEENPSLETR